MTDLDRALGIEDSLEQRRANTLVENDMRLLRALIEMREIQGLSQDDLARRLGVTQPAIAAFERYDNDPKLSTIRRYAHAVGALVDHSVVLDDGVPVESSNSSGLTVVPAQGLPIHLMVSRSSLNSSTAWSDGVHVQLRRRAAVSGLVRR